MISLWLVRITSENYWYAGSLKIFIFFTLLQKNALALKHSLSWLQDFRPNSDLLRCYLLTFSKNQLPIFLKLKEPYMVSKISYTSKN